MKKPIRHVAGRVLGIFDGLSALVSAPETAPQIMSIVLGSTFKGLIAGAAIGWFARKVNCFSASCSDAVGLLLAWLVTVSEQERRAAGVLRSDNDPRRDRRPYRRVCHAAAHRGCQARSLDCLRR
jgi:hypothetical protein